MATEAWIESAVAEPKRSVGKLIEGVAPVTPDDPEHRALAAACVRRVGNGEVAELLDMLGLAGGEPGAGMKRCTACLNDLPVEAFHKRGASGRHSHCKTCRKTTREDHA